MSYSNPTFPMPTKTLSNENKITNYKFFESINKKLFNRPTKNSQINLSSNFQGTINNKITIGTWVLVDSFTNKNYNNNQLDLVSINSSNQTFYIRIYPLNSNIYSIYVEFNNQKFPYDTFRFFINGSNNNLANQITIQTWSYIGISFDTSNYNFVLCCNAGNDIYGSNDFNGSQTFAYSNGTLRAFSDTNNYYYYQKLLYIYNIKLSMNDLFFLKYK